MGRIKQAASNSKDSQTPHETANLSWLHEHALLGRRAATRILPKWEAGKISSLGEWLIIGKSSPGKWWCYHLWKCSKHEQKWQLGMWFSGHGDIQSRVGLDDSLILFYNKRQGTSVCSSTSSSVTLLTGRGQKSQHFGYKGHIHLKGNT